MFAVFAVTGSGPVEWLGNLDSEEEFQARMAAGIYEDLAVPPSFIFVVPCAAFVEITRS